MRALGGLGGSSVSSGDEAAADKAYEATDAGHSPRGPWATKDLRICHGQFGPGRPRARSCQRRSKGRLAWIRKFDAAS